VSGFSVLASDIRTWINTNNFAALQNALFGGADIINGTNFIDETLHGYGGDDVITPGFGADIVDAGDGNDTLVVFNNEAGENWIGGAGIDTLDIRSTTTPVPSPFAVLSNGVFSGFERFSLANATAATTQVIFNYSQLGANVPLDATFVGGNANNNDWFIFVAPAGGGAFSLAGTSFTRENFVIVPGGAFDGIFLVAPNNSNAAYALTGSAEGNVLQGAQGADTLTGGASADLLIGFGGIDSYFGNGGDDFISLQGPTLPNVLQENFSLETINGGDGHDSLVVNGTIDFLGVAGSEIPNGQTAPRPVPTLTSMEGIVFAANGATSLAAPSVRGSSTNQILLARNSAPGTLDLSAWTFELWTNFDDLTQLGDRIAIQGSGGDDTLIGTAFRDYFNGETDADVGFGVDIMHGGDGDDVIDGWSGADQAFGEGGDDIIQIFADEFAPGEVLDGGADTDTLEEDQGAGTDIDFTQGTVVGFERLTLLVDSPANTMNLFFGINQLGSGLAANLAVTGSQGTDLITIQGVGNVNLSGWTFTNWSNADEPITITAGGGPTPSSAQASTTSSMAASAWMRSREDSATTPISSMRSTP
jgi:Ca2+-binding RTX toxin-like protein